MHHCIDVLTTLFRTKNMRKKEATNRTLYPGEDVGDDWGSWHWDQSTWDRWKGLPTSWRTDGGGDAVAILVLFHGERGSGDCRISLWGWLTSIWVGGHIVHKVFANILQWTVNERSIHHYDIFQACNEINLTENFHPEQFPTLSNGRTTPRWQFPHEKG